MSLALLLGGAFYFGTVITISVDQGQLAQPLLPAVIVYTVVLVVLSIIGHITIAIFAPKEANAPLDERDRRIFDRAGRVSGTVVVVGVVLSLTIYLLSYGGDVFFYSIFAGLMIGQLMEYAVRIFLYRAAI
jgi:uncharacterized membrane protein (DUF485 family)